jgi:hypothetical protein
MNIKPPEACLWGFCFRYEAKLFQVRANYQRWNYPQNL